MLKIFILVVTIASLNAISLENKEISHNSVIPTRTIFDNCQDCIDIPCHTSDSECSLKSFHKPGNRYVSFQLAIKSVKIGWIGVVLNSAEQPGMVMRLMKMF